MSSEDLNVALLALRIAVQNLPGFSMFFASTDDAVEFYLTEAQKEIEAGKKRGSNPAEDSGPDNKV